MTIDLKNISLSKDGQSYIYPSDITLNDGGFHILLGQTNAGKTSLMKLIAGLEKPDTGEICFGDKNVTNLSTQKRNIAFVHQFFINYPHLTVYHNIASPLKVAGYSDDDIKRRVLEAAEILQITPMLHRYPQELSGGQQQRTALARAIVKDADIVLLDEPLANLDYKLREELRDQLPELFSLRKSMVIYATSEPTEAMLLGGHTAIMYEGNITEYGRTQALYQNPSNLLSAKVFSDPPINTASIAKRGNKIHLNQNCSWIIDDDNHEFSSCPDGTYHMAIRPHYISPLQDKSQQSKIKGLVNVTELSGSESVIHFTLEGGDVWVAQVDGTHNLMLHKDYEFYMDHSKCFYFHDNGQRIGRGE